jgi:hypothetical protein
MHLVANEKVWYRCFAEVPGVGYQSDSERRAKLPERDATPQVQSFNFSGSRTTSLSWPTRTGSTSASPVHELAFGDYRKESSNQARERVLNALELPGELLDYHFAIQGIAELLYQRRRSEPGNLEFIEWLASWDARLVETHEQLFRVNQDGGGYFSVFAFSFLIDLHEREGYLHEALALAERFSRFRSSDPVEKLRARVAQLRAEHD